MSLRLEINGETREIRSDPETPLLYVLRDELKLKGAKLGCELEQCGACMVLADGEAVPCCAAPVASFEGRRIVTPEGIAALPEGRAVQRAFVAAAAAQCGYCTPGLVVAVTALALRGQPADRQGVAEALTPNLCRCGSHPRVLEAAMTALSAR